MSVTLKELRISKGLNQAQCAEYLGMSTRNYQNYENDAAKANTARYHAIYQKLESYGRPVITAAVLSQMPEFYTNVVTGAGLRALIHNQRYSLRVKHVANEHIFSECKMQNDDSTLGNK